MNVKVHHCKTSENWIKRNQLDFWKDNSSVALPRRCPDCGCLPLCTNDLVGAHVRKTFGNNIVYIVPVCRRCNSAGAHDYHSFVVDDSYLVPINN